MLAIRLLQDSDVWVLVDLHKLLDPISYYLEDKNFEGKQYLKERLASPRSTPI